MKTLFLSLLILVAGSSIASAQLDLILTRGAITANSLDTLVTKTVDIPNDSTETVTFFVSFAGPLKIKTYLYVKNGDYWSEYLKLDSVRVEAADSSSTTRRSYKYGPFKMNALMNLGLKNDTAGAALGTWSDLKVNAAATEFKKINNYLQYRLVVKALPAVLASGKTGAGTVTIGKQ